MAMRFWHSLRRYQGGSSVACAAYGWVGGSDMPAAGQRRRPSGRPSSAHSGATSCMHMAIPRGKHPPRREAHEHAEQSSMCVPHAPRRLRMYESALSASRRVLVLPAMEPVTRDAAKGRLVVLAAAKGKCKRGA